MCRAITYLGQPIVLNQLLYGPDNSLVKQSYDPKLMTSIQNLAGFGMAVWDTHLQDKNSPLLYRTTDLPFFDKNLKQLADQIQAHCVVAHVRGVEYSDHEVISQHNIHPFRFEPCQLVLAHNGSLADFGRMKYDLIQHVKPEIAAHITGTTDSECMYAVLLSQLEDTTKTPEMAEVCEAVKKTLKIIQDVRHKHGITISSPVNLFISNGEYLVATRYVFDFGHYPPDFSEAHLRYHSLWYTYGSEYAEVDQHFQMTGTNGLSSIIIASEPLTEDTTTWVEVMEYSLVTAYLDKGQVVVSSSDICI